MLSSLGQFFRYKTRRGGFALLQADDARDARRYREAAALYEQALLVRPNDAAIHIQCGHMHKEAGNFERAEHHYNIALGITPNDSDLALQFGHLYKITGRLEEAEQAYGRAAELDPDWPEPAIELGNLYRSGWNGRSQQNKLRQLDGRQPAWVRSLADKDYLSPDLAPMPRQNKLHKHSDSVEIRWLGHIERTCWGMKNVLRGIDSIRGFCISSVPIVEIRALINGMRFFTSSPRGYPLKYENSDKNKQKYVFNIWHDFSIFSEGECEIQLQFIDIKGGMRVHNHNALIRRPLNVAEYPSSDRVVSRPEGDARPLGEIINSLPSIVRPASRMRFTEAPRNVLVQRVDQLGDLVVSVPAIRRLRELLPGAKLVGLLSAANVELARSLKLFDDVVITNFPDDDWERRRVMSLEQQEELYRALQHFKFDVAIDLMESSSSRPLLLLSGAPYLLGFRDDRSPWLSAEYHAYTRDPRNGHEEVPHSTRLMGLIEWFGTLLKPPSAVVPRQDLSWAVLKPYGLNEGDRFAVLHTGARLEFSRWPHYDKLAMLILARTTMKIVMMSDDVTFRAKLPPELLNSGRFQLLDKRLPFDDFDTLLSFCAIFIGNDSGPSHLASLRGTNVINLYLARHNWNEWGHENHGHIITRRVPCAGCNIHHDPEECGKDYACIVNISATEVFDTMLKTLRNCGGETDAAKTEK